MLSKYVCLADSCLRAFAIEVGLTGGDFKEKFIRWLPSWIWALEADGEDCWGWLASVSCGDSCKSDTDTVEYNQLEIRLFFLGLCLWGGWEEETNSIRIFVSGSNRMKRLGLGRGMIMVVGGGRVEKEGARKNGRRCRKERNTYPSVLQYCLFWRGHVWLIKDNTLLTTMNLVLLS